MVDSRPRPLWSHRALACFDPPRGSGCKRLKPLIVLLSTSPVYAIVYSWGLMVWFSHNRNGVGRLWAGFFEPVPLYGTFDLAAVPPPYLALAHFRSGSPVGCSPTSTLGAWDSTSSPALADSVAPAQFNLAQLPLPDLSPNAVGTDTGVRVGVIPRESQASGGPSGSGVPPSHHPQDRGGRHKGARYKERIAGTDENGRSL